MDVAAARVAGRRVFTRAFKAVVCLAAAAFLLQLLFALIGLPAGVSEWIVGAREPSVSSPRYVVVLGGGGIPSETGLIRTYHAATLAPRFPEAIFIVSLPADEDPELQSVGRMKEELAMRGVPAQRIVMEYRARDTHEQAENVKALLPPAALDEPLLLVTSATHVRRSLLCFRRAGFKQVGASTALSTGAEADMGPGTFSRYVFWANLHCQVDVARELCALAVYKVRGWI